MMNAGSATTVNWIFMLFLVLLVFGAIAAIIWRSWIVGGIVLGLILLAGMLMFTVRQPAMIAERTSATLDEKETNEEILKTADLYPSVQQAGKYAAIRVYDSMQLRQPAVAVKRIRIVSTGPDDVRPIVARIFQERFSDATVVADDSHPNETFDTIVTAHIDGTGKSKCLDLTATHQGISYRANTCIKDAPWFANIDAYRAENPSGQWIVGSSSETELSPDAARQAARKDAVNKMFPLVTGKFAELNQTDHSWLRNRLEGELEIQKVIKEDFAQRLRMPVTQQATYRAGVLVDASSPQFEQLCGAILHEYYHQNSRIHRFGGGLLGLGALICLLYLFLNRATRGYFQMNLRLAATMALVAGVLLILLLIG